MILREQTPHGLVLEYRDLELLAEHRSEYQKIAVYRHPELGKLLVHDDIVMFAERYEAAYHEMLAHIPLLYHPGPKSILIIGGGDGGLSREVLRHSEVERLVQIEIDEAVIRLSRQYFPEFASAYQDPRMELRIEDGVHFVRNAGENTFDIILVDSTDPVPEGPSVELFSGRFYAACARCLKPEGLLVLQGETSYGMQEFQRQVFSRLGESFAEAGQYLSAVPFYPLGTWSLIYASQVPRARWNLRSEALEKLAGDSRGLQYLNAEVARACFTLHNYAVRPSGGS